MNYLILFTKYCFLCFVLLLSGSSCQKEKTTSLLEQSVDKRIKRMETITSKSLEIISKHDLPKGVKIISSPYTKMATDDFCPYKDCEIVFEETRQTFQHLADELCEDIFVEAVCCFDNEILYAFVRVIPNCPNLK